MKDDYFLIMNGQMFEFVSYFPVIAVFVLKIYTVCTRIIVFS